jgi:hypothetical protein
VHFQTVTPTSSSWADAGSSITQTNRNGDWGGETISGTAQFSEGTTLVDTGHLTIWDGGGGNVKGQDEGGQTLNFVGSLVTIHVVFHGTTSASGNMVGNVLNVQVNCS